MKENTRYVHIVVAGVLMGGIVMVLFSSVSALYTMVRTHAYHYSYEAPQDLAVTDVSELDPAEAVPILMYHGVVTREPVDVNTKRSVFIEQMEMLKREGYHTISIDEFDRWREGTFVLPPKPIILTFDDGRKDSFYTVDSILQELGFKATLFVVTIKANEEESFYLNWEELKDVQETGRWEIEAHGRYSHEFIPTDAQGGTGRYLTSRMYREGEGLESVADYELRVENDYRDGISDLEEQLHIKPRYFSAPLNDYGFSHDSNHPEALQFNADLTKRYFKLAFVQATQEDDGEVKESFYNYRDSPAHRLKRLEVHTMNATTLLEWLVRYKPREPFFALTGSADVSRWEAYQHRLYGNTEIRSGKLLLFTDEAQPSTRVQIGDSGWSNYSINASLERTFGRSASLLIRYLDEDNYVGLVWGGEELSLMKRVDGKEYKLDAVYPLTGSTLNVQMLVYNDTVIAQVNDSYFLTGAVSEMPRGSLALSAWDPDKGEVTLTYLEVLPVRQSWIEEHFSKLQPSS
jgi:peptidoglycan/xylan/chitin deacetylase (PgdA/CDA1 family)